MMRAHPFLGERYTASLPTLTKGKFSCELE